MNYSDYEVGAFFVGLLLLTVILSWVFLYIDSIKEQREQEDREWRSGLLKGQVCFNDEQKRKADPARPVRSESDCGKYLCKGRIELLEEAPASGSDTPQSIDGSRSISFSGEIEVSRKNEKC